MSCPYGFSIIKQRTTNTVKQTQRAVWHSLLLFLILIFSFAFLICSLYSRVGCKEAVIKPMILPSPLREKMVHD